MPWISSTYRTLINHSYALETIWLRLDFFGIIFLTLGDFVSGIYTVFWCEPLQRKIYWAMVSYSFTPSTRCYSNRILIPSVQILTLEALTIFVMVNPKFQGRHWHTFRTICFVGTGMSGFAPLAHGIYLFGWSQMLKQSGMPYYLTEGDFLGLGALVYCS